MSQLSLDGEKIEITDANLRTILANLRELVTLDKTRTEVAKYINMKIAESRDPYEIKRLQDILTDVPELSELELGMLLRILVPAWAIYIINNNQQIAADEVRVGDLILVERIATVTRVDLGDQVDINYAYASEDPQHLVVTRSSNITRVDPL